MIPNYYKLLEDLDLILNKNLALDNYNKLFCTFLSLSCSERELTVLETVIELLDYPPLCPSIYATLMEYKTMEQVIKMYPRLREPLDIIIKFCTEKDLNVSSKILIRKEYLHD